MENKVMDDLHAKVLKKFHTLCAVSGISKEQKKMIVASYGVNSSADIDTHDLLDLCHNLSQNMQNYPELDKLRKRLIAAISAYLKASRVLQLRRMAEESGNELFMKGVRIIEESYQPTQSKTFIQAEIKDEKGAWVSIPLGLTEA